MQDKENNYGEWEGTKPVILSLTQKVGVFL